MANQARVNVPITFLALWLGGKDGQAIISKDSLSKARVSSYNLQVVGNAVRFGVNLDKSPEPVWHVHDGDELLARILASTIFSTGTLATATNSQIAAISKHQIDVLCWLKDSGDVVLTLLKEGSGIEEVLRSRHQFDLLLFSHRQAASREKAN